MGMHSSTIQHQYSPATYDELGVIKVGDGLFIDNAGELSLGFEVTATAGTGGTITPAGTTRVKVGGEITITIIPDMNHFIDTVTINGIAEENPTNEYTFSNLDENKTITVTFKNAHVIFRNGIISEQFTISKTYNTASGLLEPTAVNINVLDNLLHVEIDRTAHSVAGIVITPKADLENYDKLCLSFKNKSDSNAAWLIVSTTDTYPFSDSNNVQIEQFLGTAHNFEMDISNLSTNNYIRFVVNCLNLDVEFDIEEIYLL